MKHDSLADVFSIIRNTEFKGVKEALVPMTSLSGEILRIMKDHNYIGKYSPSKGKFKVELTGNINICNVIRPRFSVGKGEFIKWEKRFLPADRKGILILSTNKGVMDHQKAKELGIGGQLLGFVY